MFEVSMRHAVAAMLALVAAYSLFGPAQAALESSEGYAFLVQIVFVPAAVFLFGLTVFLGVLAIVALLKDE